AALCAKQRGDGDAGVAARHELRDAVPERGLHQLQERKLHREVRPAPGDSLPDRAEGLAPLRVARAMREQDQRGGLGLRHAQRPVLPKPPAPRRLAPKSSTTLKATCTTGTTTSWASRSIGLMVKA